MLKKEIIRKKYNLLRKKKYFEINPVVFNPLIKYIKKKYSFKKSIAVALYYPSNFEFNIINITKNFRFNMRSSLPVIKNKNTMVFYNWKKNDTLKVNQFGFLEPLQFKKSNSPDVMLLPLLAFDKFKNRLGYGGGYYDKFLEKFLKLNKKIEIIGVGFSFQNHKKLPTSKKDIKMHQVFTEKGFI